MTRTRVLTGITTSGTLHLGNYAGAIRPAIAASRDPSMESFYFLADLHALIKVQDPARVQRSTLEIAASWIACGLDPATAWFYRQSDIPEIAELNWLLTCVAGKGILNRAHAYKASVDANREAGEDDDAGISAGLFMYPVLMAADILIFNAQKVPVGRDQIQHIEMARDFGQRFNHLYGEHLRLPEPVIADNVATLPGLDGRKMSKSYDNVIPLFAPREQLRKLIFSIVTDSRAPGEPKDAKSSNVFQLYRAFSTPEQADAMRRAFEGGIAWGEAKQALFERIDAEIAPMREEYESLLASPGHIESLLRDGAARVRARYATPLMAELRAAVGLRDLSSTVVGAGRNARPAAAGQADAVATFKQYREADGRFYFKLVRGERVLLQSGAFDAPRDAGQRVAALKQAGRLDDDATLSLGEGVDRADVDAALAQMSESAA